MSLLKSHEPNVGETALGETALMRLVDALMVWLPEIPAQTGI